mmetsp:Transcript_13206/g.46281  ORF Transcript_13206/g.46281 Transcript_13206/m.46281 type:complete len:82 (+) Transcript_13206:260-505(+)
MRGLLEGPFKALFRGAFSRVNFETPSHAPSRVAVSRGLLQGPYRGAVSKGCPGDYFEELFRGAVSRGRLHSPASPTKLKSV